LATLVHTPPRVAQKLSGRGTLDAIYSLLGLINVDLDLATKLGGASLAQAKKNFISIHRRLADGLQAIEEEEYDLVVGVVFTMIQEYGGEPMFAGAPQYGVPVVLHGYSNVSHQSVVDGLEEVATEFATKIGL
jgi:hypothetical protein